MSRIMLNTLYMTTPGALARLEGDTVRVEADGVKLIQVPLLHLGGITALGGTSITAPLMERCALDGREIVLLDMGGRFKARVVGPTTGNVLLRKAQYEASIDQAKATEIARAVVAGKVRNARSTLLRAAREVGGPAGAALNAAVEETGKKLVALPDATSLDEVRGIEGQCASAYFGVFGQMITQRKADFAFKTRTRRPPRDRVNALLSFAYALLSGDCVGAVESVGLDPQFGFLHAIRPGRPALALDLMEEFRSIVADRLVLSLINRKQIGPDHFEERSGGAVLLNEEGRKILLTAYQKRKSEEVNHPMLEDRVPFGLLPHVQARLLARHLRGDLPSYVPFMAR